MFNKPLYEFLRYVIIIKCTSLTIVIILVIIITGFCSSYDLDLFTCIFVVCIVNLPKISKSIIYSTYRERLLMPWNISYQLNFFFSYFVIVISVHSSVVIDILIVPLQMGEKSATMVLDQTLNNQSWNFFEIGSIPSLPLFSNPLSFGELVPVRVPSMGQK